MLRCQLIACLRDDHSRDVVHGLSQMLEVLGTFKRHFELVLVINLRLESGIEVLDVGLQLHIVLS